MPPNDPTTKPPRQHGSRSGGPDSRVYCDSGRTRADRRARCCSTTHPATHGFPLYCPPNPRTIPTRCLQVVEAILVRLETPHRAGTVEGIFVALDLRDSAHRTPDSSWFLPRCNCPLPSAAASPGPRETHRAASHSSPRAGDRRPRPSRSPPRSSTRGPWAAVALVFPDLALLPVFLRQPLAEGHRILPAHVSPPGDRPFGGIPASANSSRCLLQILRNLPPASPTR